MFCRGRGYRNITQKGWAKNILIVIKEKSTRDSTGLWGEKKRVQKEEKNVLRALKHGDRDF